MLEDSVNDQDGQKIGHDQPSGPPRRRPKVEEFVSEQDQHEKGDSHPFVAEPYRPVEPGTKKTPHSIADRHEWTRQTEKVAGAKDNQDQGAAKVDPGKHRGEILWRQTRAHQTLKDHHDADEKKRNLQESS